MIMFLMFLLICQLLIFRLIGIGQINEEKPAYP